MIAWDRVQELEQEIGKEDFAEIAGLFLEEVEEKIASLHLDQLAEDLHYLKGSALNLGFSTFAELCTRYEDQLRNGQKAPELDTLDGCFQASKGAFLAAIASK